MTILRLGSLNLQCANHTLRLQKLGRVLAKEIAEMISEYDALSLQEVHRAKVPLEARLYEPKKKKEGEVGPFDLGFVNDLETRLARTHVIYFEPYFKETGLHDTESDFHGQSDFGCLVAVKKQLRHVHNSGITYGTGHLNQEPVYKNHTPGSIPLRYGSPASRSGHVVTFIANNQDRNLSFLSSHGIWSRFGKVDIPARMSQNIGWSKLVTDHRRRHNLDATTPLVFMGDQNYQSTLNCFADLLQRTELFGGEPGVSLNELYGVLSTRNENYTGKILQADFGLVPESLWSNNKIKSFTVNPNMETDHALLTLEVEV